jgi:hypothetical protein
MSNARQGGKNKMSQKAPSGVEGMGEVRAGRHASVRIGGTVILVPAVHAAALATVLAEAVFADRHYDQEKKSYVFTPKEMVAPTVEWVDDPRVLPAGALKRLKVSPD